MINAPGDIFQSLIILTGGKRRYDVAAIKRIMSSIPLEMNLNNSASVGYRSQTT